jgi:hypothetical protein
MTTESMPANVGSNDGLGPGAEALCMCKDRALSACPGEWEPGCDLGNNQAHVSVYQERATDGTPPPDCNRGNSCQWSDESKTNDWRAECLLCGLRAQGSGQ